MHNYWSCVCVCAVRVSRCTIVYICFPVCTLRYTELFYVFRTYCTLLFHFHVRINNWLGLVSCWARESASVAIGCLFIFYVYSGFQRGPMRIELESNFITEDWKLRFFFRYIALAFGNFLHSGNLLNPAVVILMIAKARNVLRNDFLR